MTTLPIRFVNQLDGSPNANNDCVPASLASGAAAFGVNVSAVQLLDSEYGASYTGPTAPWRYADDASDTLRTLGLALDAITGMDEATLVARVHAEISAGNPCMLAIPSAWNNFSIPVSVRRVQRYPDGTWLSTHFVCAYDSYSGGVGCMNPWGAFRHVNTDGGWASLLVLGTIWVLRKVGTTMAGVPAGWHDDGTTLTAPNGVNTGGYIRQHILGEDWPADLVPIAPLYGVSGGWQQEFTASRLVDATTAGVMSEKPGTDFHAQLALAEQQLAAANAQVAALTAQLATANAKIAALEAQLAASGTGGTPPDPLAAQALAQLRALKSLWGQI